MTESLYERLGGTEGITQIANDVVDNHMANEVIATRFANADVQALKNAAATSVSGNRKRCYTRFTACAHRSCVYSRFGKWKRQ